MNELPRDLEAFLAGPPGKPAASEFRERLRDETETLLPKPRVWPRSIARVAGCGVFALGLVWWLTRPAPAPRPESRDLFPRFIFEDVEPMPETVDPPLSPGLVLEWQAFDSPREERGTLYWSAGQTYVATEGDYLSALRCYRQALDATPAEFRDITDEDDVLAMALKFDRSHKEK